MPDNVSWKRLEEWLQSPNLNHPNLRNIDRFAILFAKNKNSMAIGHVGMAIGGVGLQLKEALELNFFNALVSGYMLYTGNQTNIEMITDKILKRLFEVSKLHNYNTQKSFEEMMGIKVKPVIKG